MSNRLKFNFVLANPINKLDPSGHDDQSDKAQQQMEEDRKKVQEMSRRQSGMFSESSTTTENRDANGHQYSERTSADGRKIYYSNDPNAQLPKEQLPAEPQSTTPAPANKDEQQPDDDPSSADRTNAEKEIADKYNGGDQDTSNPTQPKQNEAPAKDDKTQPQQQPNQPAQQPNQPAQPPQQQNQAPPKVNPPVKKPATPPNQTPAPGNNNERARDSDRDIQQRRDRNELLHNEMTPNYDLPTTSPEAEITHQAWADPRVEAALLLDTIIDEESKKAYQAAEAIDAYVRNQPRSPNTFGPPPTIPANLQKALDDALSNLAYTAALFKKYHFDEQEIRARYSGGDVIHKLDTGKGSEAARRAIDIVHNTRDPGLESTGDEAFLIPVGTIEGMLARGAEEVAGTKIVKGLVKAVTESKGEDAKIAEGAASGLKQNVDSVITKLEEGGGGGEKAGGAAVRGETAQVVKNKAAGDAFRDELAEHLRQAGRDVATEVYKKTPFGKRFIDIEVSKEGKVLGGVETKVGRSRYTPLQQLKDAWLRIVHDYQVTVARDR